MYTKNATKDRIFDDICSLYQDALGSCSDDPQAAATLVAAHCTRELTEQLRIVGENIRLELADIRSDQ